MTKENLKGFILALLSSGFIGASFIIKKKGLRKAAAASGVRAGDFFFFFFHFCFGLNFCFFIMGFWLSQMGMCLILEFVGVGGYSYLLEPLWWIGMITSKLFNFVLFYWLCIFWSFSNQSWFDLLLKLLVCFGLCRLLFSCIIVCKNVVCVFYVVS